MFYFIITVLPTFRFQHLLTNLVVYHMVVHKAVACGSGRQLGGQYNPVVPVCAFFSSYNSFFNFVNISDFTILTIQCDAAVFAFCNNAFNFFQNFTCWLFT